LGGIVAGSFFVIPSIFVLLLLSWLAVAHSDVPAIRGLLYGVQPVVIAIVVEAVMRIGKRALGHPALWASRWQPSSRCTFLSVPFPLVVIAAAVGGVVLQRFVPRRSGRGARWAGEEESAVDRAGPSARPSSCAT
jgi:chromate transporter